MKTNAEIRNEQTVFCGRKPDFLFIGDSITMHWDLELYLNPMMYKVNRGQGGDTTEMILARAKRDVFQLEPKCIIYMAGTNDLLTTVPDLWWREDGRDKVEVLNKIIDNIDAFIKQNQSAKLYICSVLPANLCIPYCMFGYDDLVAEVNEKIKALCGQYEILYIDYYSHVLDQNGKNIIDNLTHDGVHPNGKGYAVLADVLMSHIPELKT